MFGNTLARFKDDESGSMAIELVLVTPILVWALLSTYVYFDAFRVEANVHRASNTLAEMFSREEVEITGAYLNGAREVLRTLTYEETAPDYRVTVYRYRSDNNRYVRVWSRNRGMGGNLTNAQVRALGAAGRLPMMNTIDHAILIETRVEYDAPFSIGIGPFTDTNLEDLTFETFTVIRPRRSKLCFDSTPNDDSTGLSCGPS